MRIGLDWLYWSTLGKHAESDLIEVYKIKRGYDECRESFSQSRGIKNQKRFNRNLRMTFFTQGIWNELTQLRQVL